MGITDMIAGFIQEALDDAGGVLEMQRGDGRTMRMSAV